MGGPPDEPAGGRARRAREWYGGGVSESTTKTDPGARKGLGVLLVRLRGRSCGRSRWYRCGAFDAHLRLHVVVVDVDRVQRVRLNVADHEEPDDLDNDSCTGDADSR